MACLKKKIYEMFEKNKKILVSVVLALLVIRTTASLGQIS